MFNIHFNCSGVVAWMMVYLAMMKSFFYYYYLS